MAEPSLKGFFLNLLTKINSSMAVLMNKFLIAILILLIGLILGKVVGMLIQRLLEHVEINQLIKKWTKRKLAVDKFAGTIITYLIYFIAIIMAVNEIGYTNMIINIVSIIILVLVLVSLFIFIKDLIPNITAGIYIRRRKNFKQGDNVRIRNAEGEILELNLLEVKIRKKNDDLIFIPNTEFIKSEIHRIKPSPKEKSLPKPLSEKTTED